MFNMPSVALEITATANDVISPCAIGESILVHASPSYLGLHLVALDSNAISDISEHSCERPINVISFLPTGDFFYTGSQDNAVRKWNSSLVCINVSKSSCEDWVVSLSTASRSSIVALDRIGTITLLSADDLSVQKKKKNAHQNGMTACAISYNGQR